jgi:hypothetical protein
MRIGLFATHPDICTEAGKSSPHRGGPRAMFRFARGASAMKAPAATGGRSGHWLSQLDHMLENENA